MKRSILLVVVITLSVITDRVTAQANFYNIAEIQEIRIYFEESNWDHLLDSLYEEGLSNRLLASCVINGVPLDSVGVRYKGFSSASTDRIKNPFNIALDYIISGQKYYNIDKIKLSNVIQDPSFIRETLSYEIARKYMPASQANYANVYVNDSLWGLYTNVEAVNKAFCQTHFGSSENSFFKCNPEVLDFDGENANLGNSPGTLPLDYEPYYAIKSDMGWDKLYNMIDVLNEDPSTIEHVMNVDRALWMHAFNYSLINFDSYVGYAQNYYVYEDDNGRFNPIIWDLNMSFASYRLADASEFYDGFTIPQAKTMDPLLHYASVSVYPRPLMRNLFENDTYRRMYLAHMRTIMEENFDNQEYMVRAAALYALIDTSVFNDSNKFYGYQDFQDNLTTTVSDLVDYVGISELMDARSTYLSTYPGFQGSPDFSNLSFSPNTVQLGNDLTITAQVTNATSVVLAYRYGNAGVFTKVNMFDDGNNEDGMAGDNVYGVVLSSVGNNMQYYYYAENSTAGRFMPARAAHEFYTIESQLNSSDLVINEFMANNTATIKDQDGEFDDWIELYNNTDFEISTAGLYLSDDITQLGMWAMPDITIAPDDYLIIWADSDGGQDGLHASFKLSSFGDEIYLSYNDSTIIDSVVFGPQTEDVSTGRSPNGIGSFTELQPTHDWNNDYLEVLDKEDVSIALQMFPNPANTVVHVKLIHHTEGRLLISNINGVIIESRLIYANQIESFNLNNLSGGVYVVSIVTSSTSITRKLIIK